MKIILPLFLLLFLSLGSMGKSKDTFEVYFPFNIARLTKDAENYIDRLIFKDTLLHGDKLVVLGYADFVGGKGYNDTLSMQRASNVRDYLVSVGFNKEDIRLCAGRGKVDRTDMTNRNGYAPDRKVQIVIDRIAMSQKPVPDSPPVQDDGNGVIDIGRLKVNETFVLNNIFFKLNSPVLLDKSEPDLRRLYDFLAKYRGVSVRIEGHVCCMGPQEGMDSKYKGGYLSDLRAKAIRRHLIDKGIDSIRIDAVGLGNRNPVVRNELTEEDKQKNRRVEIRITNK